MGNLNLKVERKARTLKRFLPPLGESIKKPSLLVFLGHLTCHSLFLVFPPSFYLFILISLLFSLSPSTTPQGAYKDWSTVPIQNLRSHTLPIFLTYNGSCVLPTHHPAYLVDPPILAIKRVYYRCYPFHP